MDLSKISLIELVKNITAGKTTSEEAVRYYIKNIELKKDLNAVIEVFDDAIENARIIDKKIAEGKTVGRLAGAPIIIKDIMLYKDKKVSCASKFLQDFVSPYTATVVKKLLDEDAVILGRANMDEFAMGGSNEKSFYGPCKNAHDSTRVAGGSSGGSACSVAADLCIAALGTDTGGSVRQPSAYNGVVGMKPTYGKNSRYGVVAFASSLDQVGPITKNVKDNALLQEILSGRDENDDTSIKLPTEYYLGKISEGVKSLKIGICKQINESLKGTPNFDKYNRIYNWFKSKGMEVVEVDIKNIELSLPCYYILSPAEATSNLGRFDGIKYSRRAKDAKTVGEIYAKSRTEGFGKEVKRRIMLGNFVLSSGYFDAYYNKAKAVQQNIKQNFKEAFKFCDVILSPTTSEEAFKLGEKQANPIEMYLIDLFTVPANIAGIPALTVPCAKSASGMPLGLQIFANNNNEAVIYRVADFFEQNYKEEV